MKILRSVIIALASLPAILLPACHSARNDLSPANPNINTHSSTDADSDSPAAPASTASPAPTPAKTNELSNSKVETAVADLLSDWRLGGSVSVKGIQELPQQNSAVADLQFNEFTYPVTNEGNLLKVKDFKPKPKSNALIPSPEEMFPPRKAVYGKDGKATLAHYTDGRWVLKAVNWGFDSGVKGNVEVR